MYIQPTANLILLTGCPCDSDYANTLYFNDVTEQYNYFYSLRKSGLFFNDLSTIRINENTIRIAVNSERLYDVNYIMFQNTHFQGKWFYAFVTKIKFVANGVSEIEFTIDVIQTWFFDYTLNSSFVEREHTQTDDVGDNLIEENLDCGEYVNSNLSSLFEIVPTSIVVASPYDRNGHAIDGARYGRTFSGLCFVPFNTATEAANYLSTYASVRGEVVSVFQMPSIFVLENLEAIHSFTHEENKKTSGAIDGYTPKNNKLYTYPYNFLYVSNLQGTGVAMPYEYFSDDTCAFTCVGDMSCNPSVLIAPNNYKGVSVNYDEKITLSGFPQCAFNTDLFKRWVAELVPKTAISALGGEVSALIRASQINGIITGAINRSITPTQAHGTSDSSLLFDANILTFQFTNKHIRREYAEIIDSYFQKYGYAVNKVKIPTIYNRQRWTYVKTKGCTINATMPVDDEKTICAIYDKGITFWRNASDVGKYYLSNPPII